MRKSRFLPRGIATLVVFGLLLGCSSGPSEEDLKQARFEEQLATLQQQHEDLNQARAELVALETRLAEIEAIPERDRARNASGVDRRAGGNS
ncbi:MAG: hypothetical protein P8127_08345 [Acidobacteriota bacterium]